MRGDQPDRVGYGWLGTHGVHFVVNLRTRNVDQRVRRGSQTLKSIQVPVKNEHAPTQQQALDWLELCSVGKPHKIIFVHCRGGKGRTSTFCALVRAAQEWTFNDAIAEQQRFGFMPEGIHWRQAEFLTDFFAQLRSGLSIPRL